jgi:hypothetical protein
MAGDTDLSPENFIPPPPKPATEDEMTIIAPPNAAPGGGGTYTYGPGTASSPLAIWEAGFSNNEPTSFTVEGKATAVLVSSSGETSADHEASVTATLTVTGFGVMQNSANQIPISLSDSATGKGTATATIVVNLAAYGATPDNNYEFQLTAQFSGYGRVAGGEVVVGVTDIPMY